MKNLKKVAKKIKEAVEQKEKIILFGDADLDGVTSVIILEETIKELGGSAKVYISDRERWGYGLSKEAVEEIKKDAPSILVVMDCGISNFEGALAAKKFGFQLIIIDHHQVLSTLPEASIIVDPTQKGDNYPFKKLANVGILYKLAEEILKESFSKKRERFLEFTTLATIADMVPRKEDNKIFLEEGIPLLKETRILGLQALKEETDGDFVENAVLHLNITKKKGKKNEAYFLLTAKEKKEAKKIITKIKKAHKKRRKEIKKAEEEIIKKDHKESIVFLEGNFPAHLAGAVGSRVIKKIKKPIFLYSKKNGVASGSVRMPSGGNAVEAMTESKKYLEAFGGHPEAAGFIVKEENIENFKNSLLNYFKNKK